MFQDPDLARFVGGLLEPLRGAKLEAAKAAVLKVRDAGGTGLFGVWCERYRAAVKAVA
jgi:hypothetical protein